MVFSDDGEMRRVQVESRFMHREDVVDEMVSAGAEYERM
jgi:hypothetical protein